MKYAKEFRLGNCIGSKYQSIQRELESTLKLNRFC